MEKQQHDPDCGSNFDPILCFARSEDQTPDEVFDMIQERMKTLLGNVISGRESNVVGMCDGDEFEELKNWNRGKAALSTNDFYRLGGGYGLEVADVLGKPKIAERDRQEILSQFEKNGTQLDAAIAYVTLATMDRIDEMAKERKSTFSGPKGM